MRDNQFPRVELERGAGTVRVIAGVFGDVRGAANTFSPINVWDLQLNAEAAIELLVPAGIAYFRSLEGKPYSLVSRRPKRN